MTMELHDEHDFVMEAVSSSRSVTWKERIWSAPDGWQRSKLCFTGVILPPVCFLFIALGTDITTRDLWQDNQWPTYFAMLLRWYSSQVFIPLLLFSMAGMTCWSVKPSVASKFWVRFSIYTGCLFSLIYLALILGTSGPVTLIASLFVGPGIFGVVWFLQVLTRRSHQFSIREILIVTSVVALLAVMLRNASLRTASLETLYMVVFTTLAATPTLCFVSYLRTSVWLWGEYGKSEKEPIVTVVWLVGWLLGFIASWRLAILRMLEEYHKLPTTAPDCYVSAAAAHGHSWLVGSQQSETEGKINPQMKNLKFLELALQAQFPRAHRFVRKVYNRFGPRLARLCQHRLLADLSYVLLTPLELLAIAIRRTLRINVSDVMKLFCRATES